MLPTVYEQVSADIKAGSYLFLATGSKLIFDGWQKAFGQVKIQKSDVESGDRERERELPGLKEGGKMAASDPSSAIWTTDSEKEVEKKVSNAFTGGRATVEEQRRLGGNPDVCNVHAYYFYLFEQDDEKLARLYDDCRKGKILCGECKKDLAKRVNAFLKEHVKRREEAKKHLKEYLIK